VASDLDLFFTIFSPNLLLLEFRFLYSSDIDQLKSLVQDHKHYQIILVCKAELVAELYNIIIEYDIDEIFTLGVCTEVNIKDKKVTMITSNEQDLRFHILCAAIRCTHPAETIQRQQENHGLANLSATAILKLLKQVELIL
jgi:hypothetical protein